MRRLRLERQRIEGCCYGEGALEDPGREALERGLIDKLADAPPERCPQRLDQRWRGRWENAQTIIGAGNPRPIGQQRIAVDPQLALRVAVVRIYADGLDGPVTLRCWDLKRIAKCDVQASRQLFADQRRVARANPIPRVIGRIEKRPVVAIGRMVAKPVDIYGPAADAGRALQFGRMASTSGR